MTLQAEQLIGYTIIDVIREKNGMKPDILTIMLINDKNEKLGIYASRDEEQNGHGALFANDEDADYFLIV